MLTSFRVGGVVSETSFKFFIQFVAWTAVYCTFNLILMAYFLAEYKREVRVFYSVLCSLGLQPHHTHKAVGQKPSRLRPPSMWIKTLSQINYLIYRA